MNHYLYFNFGEKLNRIKLNFEFIFLNVFVQYLRWIVNMIVEDPTPILWLSQALKYLRWHFYCNDRNFIPLTKIYNLLVT